MSQKTVAPWMGIAWSTLCASYSHHPFCTLGTLFCPPVPPRITAGPSPLTVVVNEPVMLECDATGTPAPVLLWLKDGNPVSSMVAGSPQVRHLPMDWGSMGMSLQKEAPFTCFFKSQSSCWS